MKDTLHKLIPVPFTTHLARPERSDTLLQSMLFVLFKDRPHRWHSTTAEPKELAQSCATCQSNSLSRLHQSVAPCYTGSEELCCGALHIYIYIYLIFIFIYLFIYLYLNIYIYIYLYIYIFIYIYSYVYI